MDTGYNFHFFICQNQRPEGNKLGCCFTKGSEDLLQYAKKRVKELKIEKCRINKAGCLGQCEKGPTVVIYPEGIWYSVPSIEDMEKLIQSHLVQRKPLKELQISF